MGLFRPKHPYAEGMYLCENCGAEVMDPPMIDASIDCGELGVKEEWDVYCPFCHDDALTPAHYCENPNCVNYAREDEKLCTVCKNLLTKKYLAFMSSLTGPEKEVLDDLLEGNVAAEVADALRKSAEWQRGRL